MSWQGEQDAMKVLLGTSPYKGLPTTTEGEQAAMRKLLGPAGLPSTPQWLAGFPSSSVPDEPPIEMPFWESIEAAGPDNEFETSLNLTPGQRQAERGAKTAIRNNERIINQEGMGEEYQQRLEEQEGGGVTKPLFDMLNIFPQVETGFVSELLRTGSAWEGFKQAVAEGADALPFLEKDSTEWLTGKEARMSGKGWGSFLSSEEAKALGAFLPPGLKASAAGLALDLILDPTAWTGKGLVGKGLKKLGLEEVAKGIGQVGAAAKYASPLGAAGLAGKAVMRQKAAQEFIATNPVVTSVRDTFQKDWRLKQTGAGKAFLGHEGRVQSEMDTRVKQLDGQVRNLMKEADPLQRRVFGLFLDHPLSEDYVFTQIDDLARQGVIPNERVAPLRKQAEELRRIYSDYAKEAKANGMIDYVQFLSDTYIPHVDPLSKGSEQYSKEVSKAMTGKEPFELGHKRGQGAPTPVGGGEAFQKGRVYHSAFERQINGLPVELDAAHQLAKRGFAQARGVTSNNLLNYVLTDPEIGAYKLSMGEANHMMKQAGLGHQGRAWLERELLQHPDGPKGVVNLYKGGEIEELMVVPKEIADRLNKADAFFADPDAVGKFVKQWDQYQSAWKAYAVLTPGFHMRNTLSNHFSMYLAGMPLTDMPKYQAMGMTAMSESIDHPILSKLPGAKSALGAKGRAKALGKTVDDLLYDGEEMGAKITWKPEWKKEGVEIPAGREGKPMTVKEVRDAAYQRGSLGNGQIVSETQQEATRTFYRELEQTHGTASRSFYNKLRPKMEAAIANGTELDPGTLALLKAESNGEALRSWAKLTATKAKEGVMDNFAVRLNREAGELIENTDKMALFIHLLDEGGAGLSPLKAAEINKKHLFNYQNLTETEKKLFKRVIPFYAWMRFNMPLQLESIFHDPGRYSMVPKVQNEIQAMSPDWENLPTPDYFAETNAIRLPYMRGGKPLYLQPGLPYADLNRLPRVGSLMEDAKKEAIAAMGPLPKGVLSLLANRDFFYNKPIETYPGDMSEEIPGVNKSLQWAVESQTPLVQRALSAYRAGKKNELQPWLLSNLAGVKLLPNDVLKTLRGKTYGKLQLTKTLRDKADANRKRARAEEEEE